jgi:hypothetical protein
MRAISSISSIHSRSAISSSISAFVRQRGRKSPSSFITAKHRVHAVRSPGFGVAASPVAVHTAFRQAPHPAQRLSLIRPTSGNMLVIRSFPGSIPRVISPLCIFPVWRAIISRN